MIELLSPVGDFECLKAAVQNGADAVYFGANLFSARAFATNLLRKGVPLEQIRVFLGHSQIATTKLYVVEDEDEIKFNHKRWMN